MNEKERLDSIAANVTALTMLVEALWVSELAKEPNPTAVANAMIESFFERTAHIHEQTPSEYAVLVQEKLTAIVDKAARRASLLRQKGSLG